MRYRACIGMAALFAADAAVADWTGQAEAGLVMSSGNTEAETVNAKLKFETTRNKWKHTAGGAVLYASDEGVKTANRWGVFGQSDYNFEPKTFWFGAVRHEEDDFSGFEYQASVAAGIGRRFVQNDVTSFTGTAGVGYTFVQTRDAFNAAGVLLQEGDSDSGVIFRGTLDLDHIVTETTKLINRLVVEAGSDNTFMQGDVSVQVKINTVLALAVGYAIRHNTDPPVGFKETDTLTTVNLVYELK